MRDALIITAQNRPILQGRSSLAEIAKARLRKAKKRGVYEHND